MDTNTRVVVVTVTGAGTGIGRATAHAFAADGAQVIAAGSPHSLRPPPGTTGSRRRSPTSPATGSPSGSSGWWRSRPVRSAHRSPTTRGCPRNGAPPSGLITSERAPNGYRHYDEAVAVRVCTLRHLLAAGLTLDDVRIFLPCLDGPDLLSGPIPDRALRVALHRLAVLNDRIAAQTEARDRLQAALHQAGATPRLRPAA